MFSPELLLLNLELRFNPPSLESNVEVEKVFEGFERETRPQSTRSNHIHTRSSGLLIAINMKTMKIMMRRDET